MVFFACILIIQLIDKILCTVLYRFITLIIGYKTFICVYRYYLNEQIPFHNSFLLIIQNSVKLFWTLHHTIYYVSTIQV